MKRKVLAGIGFIMALVFVSQISASYAQGMGYGMWGYDQQVVIPDKLPKPENEEWGNKLRKVLAMERLSLAQYEADSMRYRVNMPYLMVEPQEMNHVAWIERLFAAYGLSAEVKKLQVKKTKTLTEAYRNAMQLESRLVPEYEWLIKNSPDTTTAQVLDTALFQTRVHYTMFDHALRMGGGRGLGRGYGMGPGYGGYGMGPGMMGPGYGGYGMGPGMMGPGYGGRFGYQQRNQDCVKYYDDTAQLRKKLNDKQFEFSETTRDPKATTEQLDKIANEIAELQRQIYQKAPAGCRW